MSEYLTSVHNKLTGLLDTKVDALPKGFNKTRFLQNAMVVLQDTKDISKVTPESVARCMLKGAFLGLDFFNGECYAIPYGSTIRFQTDYKGEKKLVKKYAINPILDIYAKLVRTGDEFIEGIKDGKQTIEFNPVPFNDEKIIGAFAVVLYKDGSMQYETMSIKEIEETRKNFSKQGAGIAWTKSFGEMCKKTVLRRLCKHIEIDFETTEQKQEFNNASEYEFKKEAPQKAKSSLDISEDESIIEGEIIDESIEMKGDDKDETIQE